MQRRRKSHTMVNPMPLGGFGPSSLLKAAIVVDAGHLPAATGRFTRRAADTPAEGGQRVRTARDEIRFLETPGGDGAHVTPCVGMHRARHLTGDQVPVIPRIGYIDA